MITALRLILFFLCSLGSWELLRRKTSVSVLFLPSLTIAAQTGILFLAGILHCLAGGVILLLVIGAAGLVYSIWRDRGLAFLKNYLNGGFLFLAAAGIALFLFLYGQVFYHYDNFSHWALVVRQMLMTNHFPDLSDTLIEFRHYPLGSAAFIYFLARTVDSREGVMMFAQAYMMLSCMLPLMVFFETGDGISGQGSRPGKPLFRQAAGFLVLAAAANFFLVYNVPLQDLLVDSLLALTAMCAFVYAWFYGRAVKNRLAFAGIACYLVQLVQIKNSGWFFAAVIILWLLAGIRRDRKILARILVSLAPVLSAVLWKVHCMITFPGAAQGKHAMSAGYYLATIREKSPGEIRDIVLAFLKFTVSWKEIWLCAALAVLLLILIIVFCRKMLKPYGKILLFSLVMFAVYQGFLLWMYLFSMPGPEAAYLAECERYTRTILMAVVYLLVLTGMRVIAAARLSEAGAGLLALVMAGGLCLYLTAAQGTFCTAFSYERTYGERDWIEDKILEYSVPMGESYCMVVPYDDGAYSYYLARYLFQTPLVEEVIVQQASDLDQAENRYLFFVEYQNEAAQNWVWEHYPEQAGRDVLVR